MTTGEEEKWPWRFVKEGEFRPVYPERVEVGVVLPLGLL